MFSAKEIKLQKSDIEKLIFPDVFEEKLEQLGLTGKYEKVSLKNIAQSKNPFLNLIKRLKLTLMELETLNQQYVRNADSSIEQGYELHLIAANTAIIAEQMKQCGINKSNGLFQVPPDVLQNMLITAFMLGHSVANHDLKSLFVRHVTKGVKSSTKIPKNAGDKTAQKYLPMKKLVNQMASRFNEMHHGKSSKTKFSEALQDYITTLGTLDKFKKLPALCAYGKEKCPTVDKIGLYIPSTLIHYKKGSGQLTHSQIITFLTKQFPGRKVNQILTS